MAIGLFAMLVLGPIAITGMGVQLISAAPAQVCSERDAAQNALSWLGGGQVLSVEYDSVNGGYWVRIRDRRGTIQDIFVRRRC